MLVLDGVDALWVSRGERYQTVPKVTVVLIAMKYLILNTLICWSSSHVLIC